MAEPKAINYNDIIEIIKANVNLATDISNVIIKANISGVNPKELKARSKDLILLYQIMRDAVLEVENINKKIYPGMVRQTLMNLFNNINELKHETFGISNLILTTSELIKNTPELEFRVFFRFNKTLKILRSVISDINSFVESSNTLSISKMFAHNQILLSMASMTTALTVSIRAITEITGGVVKTATLEWRLKTVSKVLDEVFSIMDRLNDFIRGKADAMVNRHGGNGKSEKEIKMAELGEIKNCAIKVGALNIIIFAMRSLVLSLSQLSGLKMWFAMRKMNKRMAVFKLLIIKIGSLINSIRRHNFKDEDAKTILIFMGGLMLLKLMITKLATLAVLITLFSPLFIIMLGVIAILLLAVGGIGKLINILSKYIDEKNTAKLLSVMYCIDLIVLSMLAIIPALILMQFVIPMAGNIILSILFLTLITFAFAALFWRLSKLPIKDKTILKQVGSNILAIIIIAGMLSVLAGVLLLISVLAIPLTLAFLNICGVLVLMGLFTLMLVGLGLLFKATFFGITAFLSGMYLIMLSVGAILATAVMLLLLSTIHFDENMRDKIKMNVAFIMETVFIIIVAVFESSYKMANKNSDNKSLLGGISGLSSAVISMLAGSIVLILGVLSVFAILLITGMLYLIRDIKFSNAQKQQITDNVKMVIDAAYQVIDSIFNRNSDDTESKKDSRDWFGSILNTMAGIGSIIQAILAVGFLALSIVSIGLILILAGELKLLAHIDLQSSNIAEKVSNVIDSAVSVIDSIFGKKEEPRETGSKRTGISGAIDWLVEKGGDIFNGIGKIASMLATMGFLAMAMISVGMVYLLSSQLNSIANISFDPQVIKNKTNIIMKTATGLISYITEDASLSDLKKLGKLQSNVNTVNYILESVIDMSDAMNKFKNVSDKDVENNTKIVGNYIKYLDKVNTVKLENVKTITRMFEKMAEFAKSVNGDFDKLADTLNEKIAPLLEELKNLMGGLPKHMDSSSKAISQTIVDYSPAANLTPESIQRGAFNTGNADNEKWIEEQKRKAVEAKEEQSRIVSILNDIMDIMNGQGAYVDGVKTR